jgi:hypothetical protein
MLTYFEKVFDLPGRGMTKPLAEGILALDFPAADAARADELNAKANEGSLTEDEQAELEAYVNIGTCLHIGSPKLARRCGSLDGRLRCGSTSPCRKPV